MSDDHVFIYVTGPVFVYIISILKSLYDVETCR